MYDIEKDFKMLTKGRASNTKNNTATMTNLYKKDKNDKKHKKHLSMNGFHINQDKIVKLGDKDRTPEKNKKRQATI